MKTNLVIYFYSEGAKPSEVAEALKELGFKTTIGKYDFIYTWKGKPKESDILNLADKITSRLAGMRVGFKLESE